MLPEIRQESYLYTIPKFRVEPPDVEAFVEELQMFHSKFGDCFVRSEPRHSFYQYMVGQLSHLERKSIEPIAVNVGGKETVRSMQRAISDAVWDEPKMLSRYHEMVAEKLGAPNGVAMFDESGFVKKGKDSAGVSRQYCGNIGKVENCQVGVFMGYASRHGYTLVDKRLFFPERWFEDDYTARRWKCRIPTDLTFQTKPQLAAEMLRSLYQQDCLPFKYIVADTLYGNSLDFIEAAEECLGKTYFVSMPKDTLFWLQAPLTETKTYRYKGEQRSKRVLNTPDKPPLSCEEFATCLHEWFWFKRTVSEGTKGPIAYEFAKRRIVLVKEGLPWKTVWLVIKRTVEKEPTYWYYVSNASCCARLKLFVWLSGMRWAIEQCFGDTKSELGMDHYEVRKYTGWNRHILTCMFAHFFCGILNLRWENAPLV